MNHSEIDLRALSRSRATGTERGSAGSGGASSAVPRPSRRWRTRVLVPAVLLLATVGMLLYAARDALRPRIDVRVAAVVPAGLAAGGAPEVDGTQAETSGGQDASAAARPGAVIVQAPGWIEPDPFAIGVAALAEGVVKDVLVLEGERVEAGQEVALLIDEDARLALRAARAEHEERLREAERSRAGVSTAESRVRVEEAALAELRDEIESQRELVGIGGIAAGPFRRKEARLRGLEAAVVTAQRSVEEAEAGVRAVEAKAALAAVAVEEAELVLSRMRVLAPTGGVVLSRLVEPGSRVGRASGVGSGEGAASESPGSMGTVLRLYDPERLQARVDVPLADAARVGVGTLASVTSEALPDRAFNGRVTRIVHEANIQRNTVQFKVAIENPSPVLKPEMLVRVKLLEQGGGGSNRGAWPGSEADSAAVGGGRVLVPLAAVDPAGESRGRVWVIERNAEGQRVRVRDIELAPASEEGFATAVSGLKLTDRVVVKAPARLRDGSRVRVVGEAAADVAE